MFNKRGNIDDIEGLIVKNRQLNTKVRPFVYKNINELSIPDWDCVNLELYNENIHVDRVNKALPIMASRGCPFNCEFCSTYLTWGHNVRYRDVNLVIEEIETIISKYGIRSFHFYDDNLLLNEKWVEFFSREILKREIKINWICLSRPEIIMKHQHLLPLIREAGCKGFELGYETSDEDLYNRMNKKNSQTYFIKTYQLLKEFRFEMIEFLLMCFYDGETLHSLLKTYRDIKALKKKEFYFLTSRYFATPFLGTVFHIKSQNKGIRISNDYRYHYAIFLNFMPYSFLNSKMSYFKIDSRKLKTTFLFYQLDNLINKNQIFDIQNKIPPEMFAQYFNEFSEKERTIKEFSKFLYEKLSKYYSLNCIYEYMGRMIEFAINQGVLYHEKNTFY
ncbi:B12-binding domain-containing radical SAM protein [Paramaledivibacter caminithermalis]|uniref:B12-binding domain-containing radical SAM protein n=1 Tax=Paramaledivibacter caminithermalis TaxID=191027 RepID=UPI0010423BE7|nr:radical SAM protein [Paramaledivibacter caminithermalis]